MQAHLGEASANAEEQRTRRIRNVLKMAIAINVVFFICWIPLSSKGMIIIFSATESSIWSSCSFYLYDRITLNMALANCAINPIICLIFSNRYRQALKRLTNRSNKVQNKFFENSKPVLKRFQREKKNNKYLAIIPRARIGSESIAHEAEGRMGYSLRGHEGEKNNCFSKIPTGWSKISRIKKRLASLS